jgi:hypothetical protein
LAFRVAASFMWCDVISVAAEFIVRGGSAIHGGDDKRWQTPERYDIASDACCPQTQQQGGFCWLQAQQHCEFCWLQAEQHCDSSQQHYE